MSEQPQPIVGTCHVSIGEVTGDAQAVSELNFDQLATRYGLPRPGDYDAVNRHFQKEFNRPCPRTPLELFELLTVLKQEWLLVKDHDQHEMLSVLMGTLSRPEHKEEFARRVLLSQRELAVLIAMRELQAIDADRRATTDEIAMKATGCIDPNQMKHVMAHLRAVGLIDTKEGRGGGCWLTRVGNERAEKLASTMRAEIADLQGRNPDDVRSPDFPK